MLIKKLIKFLLIATLLLQTSCLTQKLWNDSYDETFKFFLISGDGKYIVLLGRNYHYVLDDNSGIIKELLSWDNRNIIMINIDKTNFVVDKHNNIKGYVTIETLYNNITIEQEAFLKSLGFKQKENLYMSSKITLKGVRYTPKFYDFSRFSAKFNRTYVIPVHTPPGFFARIGEATLTPITVVADSILLFGKIILLPLDIDYSSDSQ